MGATQGCAGRADSSVEAVSVTMSMMPLSWLWMRATSLRLSTGVQLFGAVGLVFVVVATIQQMLALMGFALLSIALLGLFYRRLTKQLAQRGSDLDATARHLQDSKLRSSDAEALSGHLVEHARDIIYRTDARGRFTFVNPVASQMTGF